MKTIYKVATTATGGRNGHVKSEDGSLDHNLSVPEAMGGNGGKGLNPEQLFGGAFAACFGSAIQAVAENEKIEIDAEALSVTAIIGLAKGEDGFNLKATLDCYIPGVDVETGEDLVEKAHEMCPFSKATRDNITVTLNLMIDE